MLIDHIRRGLAAGLVAGVLAGLFALVVGEIPVREAIRLEEAAEATDPAHDPAASDPDDLDVPVSRSTQQALLPVATALVGTAFGGLFGVTYHLRRRRMVETDDWRAALKLSVGAWLALVLVPLLTYPPDPPAVGDPDAIGSRSAWYLAAIVAAIVVTAGVTSLARRWRARPWSDARRQTTVGITGAAAIGLLVLVLPAGGSAGDFPADVLWQFRLASVATQTLLWAGIGATFGLLTERATSSQDVEVVV